MAQLPLSDANSVTTLDGKVIVFVGNKSIPAGKLQVKRADGTGTTFLNAVAFSMGTEKYLLLYMGDSHFAGGVASPPQQQFSAMLATAAEVFAPYDQSKHVYAVNGIKVVDLASNQLPGMLAYVQANKATYTQVIALVEGSTNDFVYAVPAQLEGVIAAKRYLCQQLALAGCKVIVVTQPPDVRFDAAHGNPWADQQANMTSFRQAIDADSVANYVTEYGAAAVTDSHMQDNQLYATSANANFPTYFAGDGTHYSAAGQNLWGRRHLVPAILRARAYMPPARLTPTDLVVDTTAKTLSFTKTTADALGVHEYSLDNSATWNTVGSLPISLANGLYPSGYLKVRVAAYGTQMAGSALSSTAAYDFSPPPPEPGWEDVTFSEVDKQNATITGNSFRSTQADNYRYETVVFTTKGFTGNGGIRAKVNISIRSESFIGLRTASVSTGGAETVTFGIRINGTEWSPTNNGANNSVLSCVNGDLLSLRREGGDLVWRQNGEEKSRTSTAGFTGFTYGAGVTAYNNAGIDSVQMIGAGGLTVR